MALKLKIFHKGLILVSVPLVFEVLFVLVLVWLLRQAEHEIFAESKAKDIVARIDTIRTAFSDGTDAIGRFKWTHEPSAERKFHACLQKIRTEVEDTKTLKGLNERETELARVVRENTEPAIAEMQAAMNAKPLELIGRMLSDIGKLNPNSPGSKLRAAADELHRLETDIVDKTPEEKSRTRNSIQLALTGGLFANVAITILLTFYLSRSITERLACVTDNTSRLAKRQTLNPRVGGTDEITLLDDCLHVTAEELSRLENFKKEMTAMVSHELRSPLTSILVTLQALDRGILGEIPEKAKSKVNNAERSANRLIRLINDLLDIDRMESGMLELSFKEISLEKLLTDAIEAVKELAAKLEINIRKDCKASLVVADEERLLQVLINLLSNAIKYSPVKGTIDLFAVDRSDYIELIVRDHGRGIPADSVDKVFDRFQQVDQSDPREKKGSGLGLAICKAIMEQHRGSIGVESEEGKGSTFWFRIPKDLKAIA